MSATSKYEAAVHKAERYAQQKAERELGLKQLYAVKDEITAVGLVATDTLVKEYQLLRERAIAEATMYGIGAILEALRNTR